jgi:hypothetical protein
MYPFCFRHQPAAAADGMRLPLQLPPGKKVVLVAGWEVEIAVKGCVRRSCG